MSIPSCDTCKWFCQFPEGALANLDIGELSELETAGTCRKKTPTHVPSILLAVFPTVLGDWYCGCYKQKKEKEGESHG